MPANFRTSEIWLGLQPALHRPQPHGPQARNRLAVASLRLTAPPHQESAFALSVGPEGQPRARLRARRRPQVRINVGIGDRVGCACAGVRPQRQAQLRREPPQTAAKVVALSGRTGDLAGAGVGLFTYRIVRTGVTATQHWPLAEVALSLLADL